MYLQHNTHGVCRGARQERRNGGRVQTTREMRRRTTNINQRTNERTDEQHRKNNNEVRRSDASTLTRSQSTNAQTLKKLKKKKLKNKNSKNNNNIKTQKLKTPKGNGREAKTKKRKSFSQSVIRQSFIQSVSSFLLSYVLWAIQDPLVLTPSTYDWTDLRLTLTVTLSEFEDSGGLYGTTITQYSMTECW